MELSFTPRQLDLELGLLLGDLHVKLHALLGPERAALAFRFPPGRQDPWEFPPEDIPVDEFPIREEAHELAAYVMEQKEYRYASLALSSLSLLTDWIKPDLEDYWSQAHVAWPEAAETGTTPSDGADDIAQAIGVHYRGILKRLVLLGSARLKLDSGEPLTLSELAALAGHNERSVMSAASRGEFPSETAGDSRRRLVAAEDALAWLIPRGYKPTASSSSPAPSQKDPEVASFDAVFVPVARDGTVFEPECRTSGGFTIGSKGAELKVKDYFEALEALSKMTTPHWRRPNAAGNWGIVAGVEWHRMSKKVLDAKLEKTLSGFREKRSEKDS